MTPAEVLRDVQGYAGAGRISVGDHARKRMSERGVTYQDLAHSLKNAGSARKAEKPGRWIEGPDLDGDDLSCVVVLEDGVVVVTVF